MKPKDIDDFIGRVYSSQKYGAKKRNHTKPSYTKKQLKEWVSSQSNFKKLYKNWVKSNYNKWLKPSIDRIDNNISYNLDNIQLMTWKENYEKAMSEFRDGTLIHGTHPQKIVVSINKKTKIKNEYPSVHEASRKTGINRANISSVCIGSANRKTAGGYYWNFK